jgi:hypothetical protein
MKHETMKKHLLLLCFACFGISVYGQNSVPNGTFENWITGTFNNPQYYPYTSNIATYLKQGVFNVTRTTDAYHGSYAVQVATTTIPGDTAFGYFVNILPGNNSPSQWHGGMPYNQIPTGVRGYYKYNVATADSATMIIAFSKLGNNIGTYYLKIGGVNTSYKLFSINFNPALSTTPDSVEFGALSCKFSPPMQQPHGVAGSVLKLDSVSFTGVSSQPAMMNGDFELWQPQTLNFPAQWYPLSGGDQGTGVFQTTDAVKGTYAVELKTFLGSQNNHPAAQPAAISTGYYPSNCTGNCSQRGGYPFSNAKDTLVFSYKYSPSANDSARVVQSFKKNGTPVGATFVYLHASATYQVKQLPFNIGINPDTVIVSISSSDFRDTLTTFVGSDLKIDEMYFKSQAIITAVSPVTGENANSISIFPNPSEGKFQIKSSGAEIRRLEIYDALGKRIYLNSKYRQETNEIDLSRYPKGIYFVKIFDGLKIYTEKIVKK